MAVALYVPRVNNNDDEVKLVEVLVAIGAAVSKGQVVAQVETDKAVVEVEAPADGFVLAVQGKVDDVVKVGEILMWLGAAATEVPPVQDTQNATATPMGGTPTAKARALLEQHGIDAALVPSSGERLSVADVERYLASGGAGNAVAAAASSPHAALPNVPGNAVPLRSEEKGMMATVAWHRDVAVPGYIEVTYDIAPWEVHAQLFQQQHALLLSPLLPLMAWQLAELAKELPKINATIIGNKRYEYSTVNLGFTVQAGAVLYLTVLRDACSLGQVGFVNALVELQRGAAGHRLTANETQGATIGFSSMARWKVSRHIPILSPQTAVMVAHTVGQDGVGVLGATYDHRVNNGSDVAAMLRKLSKPRSIQ